jgi:hypothetical protein
VCRGVCCIVQPAKPATDSGDEANAKSVKSASKRRPRSKSRSGTVKHRPSSSINRSRMQSLVELENKVAEERMKKIQPTVVCQPNRPSKPRKTEADTSPVAPIAV